MVHREVGGDERTGIMYTTDSGTAQANRVPGASAGEGGGSCTGRRIELVSPAGPTRFQQTVQQMAAMALA